MRIVSLIASATEIVSALGFADALVGRSHECDRPAGVEALPVVTEPKFATDGTSADVDRRVKAILAEALSVYRVDAERLRALEPDVIVTQTQCEVCAVSPGDLEEALREWTGREPTLVALSPDSLEDVLDDVRTVARALGAEPRGEAVVTAMVERMEAVETVAAGLAERPGVACVEWIEPLMAAGNWMPELVRLAGGESLFGEPGVHSPWMEWGDLVAADPEVVIVSPCGFDLERTRAETRVLASRPEWARLSAVRDGRVAIADGVAHFHRPGPRLPESLEVLAEILHPEAFDFGWKGVAWSPA